MRATVNPNVCVCELHKKWQQRRTFVKLIRTCKIKLKHLKQENAYINDSNDINAVSILANNDRHLAGYARMGLTLSRANTNTHYATEWQYCCAVRCLGGVRAAKKLLNEFYWYNTSTPSTTPPRTP